MSNANVAGTTNERRIDLVGVALQQKAVLRSLAIILGFTCVFIAMIPARAAMSPAAALTARVILTSAQLGVSIYAAICCVRLARSMGRGTAERVLVSILCLIPVINIIQCAKIVVVASLQLRAAGLKVGLMGINREEILKLQEGHCHGCGYSMAGNTSGVCPECGAGRVMRAAA